MPSLYGIFHTAKMHLFSAFQRIFFLYVWFGSWQICCTKSNIFEGSIIESSFSQIPKMVLQFGKNKLKMTAYKNYFQIGICNIEQNNYILQFQSVYIRFYGPAALVIMARSDPYKTWYLPQPKYIIDLHLTNQYAYYICVMGQIILGYLRKFCNWIYFLSLIHDISSL